MLKLATGNKTRKQSVQHLIQLDALRAFAVSGVLIHHFLPASIIIAPFGAMGVKLFFVLSGFLITGILLKGRDIAKTTEQGTGFTLRRFYIRRFLRIFPLFYIVLLLITIIDISPARQTFFWHAAYLSNVYITKTGNWPGPLSLFWTLAVEEQFYLVWPWVILCTPKRHLLKLVFLIILTAPVFRLTIALLGLNFSNWAVLPFACLDTLGLGALLALMSNSDMVQSHHRQIFLKTSLYIGMPMLVIELSLYYLKRGEVWQLITFDTMMGLSCVWLIANAAKGFSGIAGKLLESRLLIYMGTISYGIYIYHSFISVILDWLLSLLKQRFLLVASLTAALVFISFIGLIASKRFQRFLKNKALLKPLLYLGGCSLLMNLLIYAAMKAGVLSLQHMNTAIYFVLSCTLTFAIAAVSWEFFEKPINNWKERFSYQKESTDMPKAF